MTKGMQSFDTEIIIFIDFNFKKGFHGPLNDEIRLTEIESLLCVSC